MNTSIYFLSQYALKELKDTYDEHEIRSICQLIFMDVFKYTNIDIHIKKYESLSESIVNKFYEIITQLKTNKPIQYIIGETEFTGLKFAVNEATLIPRPETEELVYWIKETAPAQASILDIGTGSGCIAISLAHLLPGSTICGIDISEQAIETARQNARTNLCEVAFLTRDIFTYTPSPGEKFDIIVSNPPYVRNCEKAGMHQRVLDFEPSQALFVPDYDPLIFYRQIAEFGKHYLTKQGVLFFEINEALGPDTQNMLEQSGYTNIILKKDIFEKNRFIKCNRYAE